MKIRCIHIENFRSIKKLVFEPDNICALVGENGAGKSNILAALDFLLGERYPSSSRLDSSDYFRHDVSRTILISVDFECNSSAVKKFWCKFQQNKNDIVRYEPAWDDVRTSDMRENLPVIFIDSHRDIDRHLRQSRWALFGRVLHRFHKQFPQSKIQELESKFNETLELLRTYDFQKFEEELRKAFTEQIRHVNKSLELEFKAFDPLSYYKSINLLLREEEHALSLPEAGDGMRNMAILAMFRAYTKTFKGDAILAIEEPELYLHPHAERNLAKLFRELADAGNQLFYSTHSSHFVEIEHFDEICLVERKEDEEGDLCTHLRNASVEDLLAARERLRPDKPATIEGIRERYKNLYGLEHSEAFFGRKIVLVEGPTEENALPIYAAALDFDFDAHGVSVVSANGKNNLDELYQLYEAFDIPLYLVFDSDRGTSDNDKLKCNEVLLRMLGENEDREPEGQVNATYAISDKDFEAEIRSSIGESLYSSLMSDASHQLGRVGKGIKARYVANQLVKQDNIPAYICRIIDAVKKLALNSKE